MTFISGWKEYIESVQQITPKGEAMYVLCVRIVFTAQDCGGQL